MTITNYKTPDSAIFGLNSKDERVFFKDVRQVTDSKEFAEKAFDNLSEEQEQTVCNYIRTELL